MHLIWYVYTVHTIPCHVNKGIFLYQNLVQEIYVKLTQYILLCTLVRVVCYSMLKSKIHVGIDLASVM